MEVYEAAEGETGQQGISRGEQRQLQVDKEESGARAEAGERVD